MGVDNTVTSFCAAKGRVPNDTERRIIERIGVDALLDDLRDAEEECGY